MKKKVERSPFEPGDRPVPPVKGAVIGPEDVLVRPSQGLERQAEQMRSVGEQGAL